MSRTDAARAVEALTPWSNGRRFANFTEEPVDAASLFPADALARLRSIRNRVDPHGVFVANHAI